MKPLSRRELLHRAATGTGAVMLTQAGVSAGATPRLFRGGRFSGGVISGDPSPHGITLLTRLAGVEGRGGVTLELARDPGFRKVVGRSVLRTSDALDHVVKARLEGLKPHRRYWYRFATKTHHSRVGRFRTAPPPGSREPIRFGVFTCQEYTNGYFNAQAALASEDLDFVLNLGNYLYADVAFAGDEAIRELDDPDPATTLAAYRRRYHAYRNDRDLRAMHAAHPIVSTWDEGEVTLGYAPGSTTSEGYVVPAEPTGSPGAAFRAWFEAMPHYPPTRNKTRVFGRRSFGRTLDLLVLDTRQYRDAPPCNNNGDPACPDLSAPREMLGDFQGGYVSDQLDESESRWRIVASPSPVASFLDAPNHYHGFDSWQGYPAAREELLVALGGLPGVAVLSGNLRRFLATTIADANGAPIASEFTCGAVSARLEDDSEEDRQRVADANPRLQHYDPGHHGYATCAVSRDELSVRFHKLRTIWERSRVQDDSIHWTLPRSRPFFD